MKDSHLVAIFEQMSLLGKTATLKILKICLQELLNLKLAMKRYSSTSKVSWVVSLTQKSKANMLKNDDFFYQTKK
jgi:hypothetical protein